MLALNEGDAVEHMQVETDREATSVCATSVRGGEHLSAMVAFERQR